MVVLEGCDSMVGYFVQLLLDVGHKSRIPTNKKGPKLKPNLLRTKILTFQTLNKHHLKTLTNIIFVFRIIR